MQYTHNGITLCHHLGHSMFISSKNSLQASKKSAYKEDDDVSNNDDSSGSDFDDDDDPDKIEVPGERFHIG